MADRALQKAKMVKDDELYTLYKDVEKELDSYADAFRGKVVYCNCDSADSAFVRYFKNNFERLGLKQLSYSIITMGQEDSAKYYEVHRDRMITFTVAGDGSFDSAACRAILKHANIVVTNPPFSQLRKFYDVVKHEYGKDLLIVAPLTALTYKDIFADVKNGNVHCGNNAISTFKRPDGTFRQFGSIIWLTTLNRDADNEVKYVNLTKLYTPIAYPTYDNFDAIEVSKVADIPIDYDGVMGVPITFLTKQFTTHFKVIGSNRGKNALITKLCLNKKEVFVRVFIQKVKV